MNSAAMFDYSQCLRTKPRWAKVVCGALLATVLVEVTLPHAVVLAQAQVSEQIVLDMESIYEQEFTNRDAQIVQQTLKIVPKEYLSTLADITIGEEGHDVPRGRAHATKIIMNKTDIADEAEFRAVLVHEMAHTIDLGHFKGESPIGSPFMNDGRPIPIDDPSVDLYQITFQNSETVRPDVYREDFISDYATASVFENFAENFIAYVLQNDFFAQRAQQSPKLQAQYDFMLQTVFDGRKFTLDPTETYPVTVYDTTVMSYNMEQFVALLEAEPENRAMPAPSLLAGTGTGPMPSGSGGGGSGNNSGQSQADALRAALQARLQAQAGNSL